MGCREISSDGNLVLQKGREEKKERNEGRKQGKTLELVNIKYFSFSLFKIHDDFEQNLLSHGLVRESQPLTTWFCTV